MGRWGSMVELYAHPPGASALLEEMGNKLENK